MPPIDVSGINVPFSSFAAAALCAANGAVARLESVNALGIPGNISPVEEDAVDPLFPSLEFLKEGLTEVKEFIPAFSPNGDKAGAASLLSVANGFASRVASADFVVWPKFVSLF